VEFLLNKWLTDLLNNLFPRVCVLCDAPGREHLDLCDGCITDLPWLKHCCAVCAVPLRLHQPQPNPAKQHTLCGQCLTNRPSFSRCISAFEYRYPVDKLIIEFKFSQQLIIGKVLAYLAAEIVQQQTDENDLPDLLVPVPIHPKRLRQRGFNQALEIADVMSQRLVIPVDYQSCSRLINTASQKLLSAKQRRSNLKGAFSVNRSVAEQSIAIVDDVVTTGATAEALAHCMVKAGARKVQVWTLARTPDPLIG
jgi:ComF family protein